MSSSIDHRSAGPDDPTGRFAAVGPARAPGPQHPGYHPPVPGPPFPRVGPGAPGPWPPTGYRAAPPARPRAGWIAVAACGGVLLLTLLVAAVSANSAMTVPGTLTLHSSSYLTPGSSCEGRNLASWLHSGTIVTIYDASGDVVGTTTLRTGTATASGSGWASGYADTCVFPFTLTDVPAGDDFYRVAAGSSSGGVTFTADQLRDGGAHLSIGD